MIRPATVLPDAGSRLEERAEEAFREFVSDPRFPCLAAKGALRTGGLRLRVLGALGSAHSADSLARELTDFVASMSAEQHRGLRAFVAVFPRAVPRDEAEFERRLWLQLQRLHDRDGSPDGWDPGVAADPDDPRFAFCFAGRALFVVGMHPASSRLARRFRWPALVFNPHEQFEQLREDGRFAPLRDAVREREIALQGTLNPNLADFGERSEARQYSGRETGPEWRCPFHHRDAP